MEIDFRNTNTVWASIIVATLQKLGLNFAVICPGSRSTPLTVAFAACRDIEAIPILDERSAAFFALGIAKRSGFPVALVCTSGTAGANFYPAVIEARYSSVPLLILTADRPPELRDCHSGQTIDQLKLYGNYPNWQTELAVPSTDLGMLSYLRQNIVRAIDRSLFPVKGPVHLNIPFRDPLPPIPVPETNRIKSIFDSKQFFSNIIFSRHPVSLSPLDSVSLLEEWQLQDRGIIIAGLARSQDPEKYCRAIASLSQFLGWPTLAEVLSPVRNYAKLNPNLVSTYDLILRDRNLADKLRPEIVIQLGELPTSKELRSWLDYTRSQRWIVAPSLDNFDPLHGNTIHLNTSVEELITNFISEPNNYHNSEYLNIWLNAENQVRRAIDLKMSAMEHFFEGKIAWLLSKSLPPETPIFIANSMPVRDAEFFWCPNHNKMIPFFNRGANGIDGTLSTALGIAYRNHKNCVMLSGDLAFLHDTNGFLIANKFLGHLTIILINNNGGGIFEMLPIVEFDPPFEEFFATPQNIDFAKLCATYNVEHRIIKNWQELKQLLNPLPKSGIRVLEIRSDRKKDAKWRKENLSKFITL
ncbi:MAG: 2-succinyl-5-enolpyruvyl-6-hydroxy-3-cyclohexene-1-carboxylic-acid synthase [Prochloraceae cyanobacterium]